jgi:DNA-binding NarL/FixJ family response regulator
MANESSATVFEYDGLTGQTVHRQETQEEIEQKALAVNELREAELTTEAKKTARETALAKLAALGLTEEEIAAL